MLLFRVLQSFLNAQHSVMPMAWAAMISSFIIHPIVLHIMVKHFGFFGSGFAVSITQTCMGLILVLILKFKPSYYLPETWPVVSIASVNDALAMRPIQMFLALSLGGVLSLSDCWFGRPFVSWLGPLELFLYVFIRSHTTLFRSHL